MIIQLYLQKVTLELIDSSRIWNKWITYVTLIPEPDLFLVNTDQQYTSYLRLRTVRKSFHSNFLLLEWRKPKLK
jgi:hypothetical protein